MNEKQTLNRWEKRKLQTKQLLIDTTLQLLLEHGYTDLSIQQIADTADLSRGTFYLHFGSIDELVWTVVESAMEGTRQEIFERFQTMPYKEAKYFVWREIFQFAHNNRDMLRVLFGEKGHPAFVKQIEGYLKQVIKLGIENGIFQPEQHQHIPLEFAIEFMVGALLRVMIWSLDTDYSPSELGQYFYETQFSETMPNEFR